MPANFNNNQLRYNSPSGIDTGPFSIELYGYFTDPTTRQYLVHLNQATPVTFNTYVQLEVGTFWLIVGGQFNNPAGAMINIPMYQWNHCVFTCLNTTASGNLGTRGYLNGVLLDNGVNGGNPTVGGTHNGTITLSGRDLDALRRILGNGKLHKVRVYNRVLPASDIALAYQDPLNHDLANKYPGNTIFRADLDTNFDSVPPPLSSGLSVTGLNTGAVTLTNQYPLNYPGVGAFLNYTSGVTTSAGRITSIVDQSSNGISFVSSGSAGPPYSLQSSGVGLNIPNAVFSNFAGANFLNSPQTSSGLINTTSGFTVVSFQNAYRLGTAAEQTICHFGNPDTSANSTVRIYIDTTGVLNVSSPSGVTRRSAYATHCATPRMLAVVSNGSGVNIYNGKLKTSSTGAFPSFASTGVRIGDNCGTMTTPFGGNAYMQIFYQRPLSDAEINNLDNWGQTLYNYRDPTRVLSAEGSSTMEGLHAESNQNLLHLVGSGFADFLIYNFAQAGTAVGTYLSQYSNQAGSSGALNGFTKPNRYMLLQPFGNDWDGVTSLSTIQSNYDTLYTNISNDYGTVITLDAQPRTDYALDSQDIQRELDLLSFITYTQSKGLNIPRSPLFSPASNSATDIQAIANGTQYRGDQIHFSQIGYINRSRDIGVFFSALLSPVVTGPRRRRLDSLSALGVLNVLDKGISNGD